MVNLEDIRPKKSYFTLKLIPGKKFFLRPICLEDEIWLRQTYPGDKITEVFQDNNPDMKEICRIAWHLLINKGEFKKQEETFVSDEGEVLKHTVGGLTLLVRSVTCMEDKVSLMLAITETMGLSRKAFHELRQAIEGEEDKKKIQEIVRKKISR